MLTRARMIFLLLALCFSLLAAQAPKSSSVQRSPSDVKALAALDPIDTHTHVAKGDPAFYSMLDRLHMHILDILYVDDHDQYRKDLNRQRQDAESVVQASQGPARLCTTFDPFRFNSTDFSTSAIHDLDKDFANGAIAVKIWKNVGMELKDNNGHYVFADDLRFE